MTEAHRIAVSYIRRFAGLIVVAFGIRFLAFGGLCSAVYLLSFPAEGDLNNLGLAVMVGVPTALVGGMIIAAGRAFRVKR